MVGQVIEIDYQLYVKFENGVVAILPDFFNLNCVGVWRDFSTVSYIVDYDTFKEESKIGSSSTLPFLLKKDLVEYLKLIKLNVHYSRRNAISNETRIEVSDIIKRRKLSGYPDGKNCVPLMRDRLLKIRKLRTKIKTI